MLTVYQLGPNGRICKAAEPTVALQQGVFLWGDLLVPPGQPTDDNLRHEKALEEALGVDVPTPLERAAIEDSARFYEDDGALILTTTLLGQRKDGPFVSDAVTFILAKGRLGTVRTIRPRAFEISAGRASARIECASDGAEVLLALLDGVVERCADILAEGAQQASALSGKVFTAPPSGDSFDADVRELGRIGTLAGLVYGSLASLARLIVFAQAAAGRYALDTERLSRLATDVEQLERAAEALQAQCGFVLDAVLGLVGARQNKVLRALSLATIGFVPPTLVASVFGMNFEAMSWFQTPWGPWAGFGLMILAPALLLLVARLRRWF
jgi:magnesium transporter